MNVRICTKCGFVGLDQIDFGMCWSYGKYRFRYKCKLCRSKETKQWRKDNPKHKKEYDNQWRKDNPEYSKQYRQEHPDKYKQWFEDNSDKLKEYRNNHRALDAGLDGTFDKGHLRHMYICQKGLCVCCKQPFPFNKMTVDHIKPISKPGSSNWPNNIQLLCKSCNSSKKNHHATDFRESKPVFFGEIIGRLKKVFTFSFRYVIVVTYC